MGFNSGFKGLIVPRHIGMASIKFIACQSHSISHYKNLQTKVMKCCASIYFNGQYLKKDVRSFLISIGS